MSQQDQVSFRAGTLQAMLVTVALSIFSPIAPQAADKSPMRPSVEGVTIHEECLGGGSGMPVNMCEYSVRNNTGVRMCYRLLAHITGSYDMLPSFHDTEWQECRPVGETVPLGKQKIFVPMHCWGSYPDNRCDALSVQDIYVRVMPFPAAGPCKGYRGVVDVDPATGDWFCDVDRAASLSQRPASEIERMCLAQGMKLLRPLGQGPAVPAAAVGTAPGMAAPPPPLDVSALVKGWGSLEWGITLAEFRTLFPGASVENGWWSTGTGIEKFAGKWMTVRYAFNKHERLATVQFLPADEQRAAVEEALQGALGQPTSDTPSQRIWTLPDGDVQVSLTLSGAMVLVNHQALARD